MEGIGGEPLLEERPAEVLDPRTAYQVVSILEGVVQRGTGVAIRQAGNGRWPARPARRADFRDAWFIGFSPDLALGRVSSATTISNRSVRRAGRACRRADLP
jgi:membrane peptidoglycan carboxypeptidase